jgi:uncharacterized protein
LKVFENHGKGIGQRGKDNGVLVLLTVGERQVRITTGYGLEKTIPDQLATEIVQSMVPALAHGDYGGGLSVGVARIITRIRAARAVN